MTNTAAKFLLIFLALQAIHAASEGSAVERFLIDGVTVQSGAWLISKIDPASDVLAVGHQIIAPCGSLSILNGCDGMEAVLLLAAALGAAPKSRACRVAGLIAAVPFVFFVNQARLVGLFFTYCKARTWFASLHGYIAPTGVIIACCIFFLCWLQCCQSEHGER